MGGGAGPGEPGTLYSWKLGEGTMAESCVFLQDVLWPGRAKVGLLRLPPGTLFPECLPPSPAIRSDSVSIVPAPGLHGGMLYVDIGATSQELHVVWLGCHRPAGCFQLKTQMFKVGLKIGETYWGPGLPSPPLSAGISGHLASGGSPLSRPLPPLHPGHPHSG